MAHKSLIGKQRYAARSDRERERLQSQISTYAIRHHAEDARQQLRIASGRLEEERISPIAKLEGWIDRTIRLVDAMPHFCAIKDGTVEG